MINQSSIVKIKEGHIHQCLSALCDYEFMTKNLAIQIKFIDCDFPSSFERWKVKGEWFFPLVPKIRKTYFLRFFVRWRINTAQITVQLVRFCLTGADSYSLMSIHRSISPRINLFSHILVITLKKPMENCEYIFV